MWLSLESVEFEDGDFLLMAALNCLATTRLLEQMVTAGKWMFQTA